MSDALDPLTDGHGRDTLMGALAAVDASNSLAVGGELLFAAR